MEVDRPIKNYITWNLSVCVCVLKILFFALYKSKCETQLKEKKASTKSRTESFNSEKL